MSEPNISQCYQFGDGIVSAIIHDEEKTYVVFMPESEINIEDLTEKMSTEKDIGKKADIHMKYVGDSVIAYYKLGTGNIKEISK